MLQTELVGLEDARWTRLLEEADGDDYQSPGYVRLAASIERGEAVGLYGRGSAGEFLIPLIVRELPPLGEGRLRGWRDALSPYGYPGALVVGSFSAEADQLAGCVNETLRANSILCGFLRMNPMRSSADPVLRRLGAVIASGETVFYDLTLDDQVLWKETRREHKHDIQALTEDGYTTRFDHWPDFEPFKQLYAETMRRVGATEYYLFDDAFFDALRAQLGPRLHLVSVVSPEGELASAGTFLTGGDGIIHAHLTGTWPNRVEACKLVYDTAWREFQRRGFRVLHMGGGMNRPNDSLLHFKKGLAKGRTFFRSVRVVADLERYRLASAATGINALDLEAYFPAYRRPDVVLPARVAQPRIAPAQQEATL